MANNTTLSDLQRILLSTASQRQDGSIFPPAESIAKDEKRIRAAVAALLKQGFVEEIPTKDRRHACREEEGQPISLALTDAGRIIIAPDTHAAPTAHSSKPKEDSHAALRASKASIVLDLLRRPEGATLTELVDATSWLPHTTRAALTGLRKKGHVLEKSKREDATCYRIAEVA